LDNKISEENLEEIFLEIKDKIYVREEDKTIIIPPNQIYSLNESGIKLLNYLNKTGDLKEIIDRSSEPEKTKLELFEFLTSIISLMKEELDEEKTAGIEFQEFKKGFYTYPVLSEFAITHRCNLRCKFCYLEKYDTKEMSTKKAKKIILKLKTEAKVPFISFTGGEPVLRDDLEELMEYSVSIGLKVNLISNGTLLTEEKVKSLKKAGLRSAQISLESPEREIHNFLTNSKSFDKTVKGIQNLIAQNIYVHTNTTINRYNFKSMFDYPEFAKSIGLEKFSANIIIPIGTAGKHEELWLDYTEIGDIIDEIKINADKYKIEFIWYSPLPYCIYNPISKGLGSKSCAACHGLVSIDPEGYINPCSSYPERVGSWLKKDFKKIWFSEKAVSFREMDYLPEICKNCEYKEMCAGACPLYWKARGYNEITGK
jgi:radical SAM protein with 4Fe4S-binding SPASM domain